MNYPMYTDTQLRAMGLPTSVGGRVQGYTPGTPMTHLPGQRQQPAGFNEAVYPSMVPQAQMQQQQGGMPAQALPQLQALMQLAQGQQQRPQQQQQQPMNPFVMDQSGWGGMPNFYQQAMLLAQGKAPPQSAIPTFPPGRFG